MESVNKNKVELAKKLTQKETIHLLNRFGFGASIEEIKGFTLHLFEKRLRVKTILWGQELGGKDMEYLRAHWMNCLIRSNQQTFEKIALFWHHHFACICDKPHLALQFSNSIRANTLGSFRSLLISVSQTGAMLDFLDGKKNKSKSPNENFARELCEIYSLGLNNGYTEQDVKEIARCFTGWKYNEDGQFYIREKQFDNGNKTIFGKTGNFNGEDVVNLILDKFECAQFVAGSLYSFFVNDIPNEQNIKEIATILYSNNYDIYSAVMHIAQSHWFYSEENIMAKIKSPIELTVGMADDFNLQCKENTNWSFILKLLGQELYKPLNVKGWPEGRKWINSHSLPMRLLIPQLILGIRNEELALTPDYDQNPGATMRFKQLSSRLDFKVDWDYFNHWAGKISPYEKWFNGLMRGRFSDEDFKFLLSLPEYQLN